MGRYARPREIAEALAILAQGRERGRPPVVLAGGTDHYPARLGQTCDEDILDIAGIADLRGIGETETGWRIGAATTWSDVIEAPLPALFDGLKAAAREVGGVQIQNRGTVAGNLCNASPAADGVPPLLTLDASVALIGPRATRHLPLADFLLGPRRTARQPDELVGAIHVPRAAGRGGFLKIGARRYLVISIVMAASVVEVIDGVVARAALAVGACGPVASRLPALEAAVTGRPPGAVAVTAAHLAPLAPIDDARADAAYRMEAAAVAVGRLLAAAA